MIRLHEPFKEIHFSHMHVLNSGNLTIQEVYKLFKGDIVIIWIDQLYIYIFAIVCYYLSSL